ncbi:MAG: class I SAM-dependent methyltransferase [Dehalococcoidia bacterium]
MWQTQSWQDKVERVHRIHNYVTALNTQIALNALDAQPGNRVLVAGCGYGREAIQLQAMDSRLQITAVDQSPDMVNAACERRLNARVADVAALPFEDDSFDRVLCFGVLMHVEDDHAGLRELARVTAPQGRLVWTFNNARSPMGWLVRTLWKLRSASRPGVRQEFRSPAHWSQVLPGLNLIGGSFMPGIGPDFAYPLAVAANRIGSLLPGSQYQVTASWHNNAPDIRG